MARATAPITTSDVADYYDRNTGRFLFMSGGAPSIHRALWAPGVASAREAAAHVDHLVADEIASFVDTSAGFVVLDFGCGIGGTLLHLAARFSSARLVGVTVSAKQAAVASRLARRHGLAERCAFTLADFQTIDLGVRADALLAIESFVHSTSVDAFLANATRHLGVGGRLLVVDDFLAAPVESLTHPQRTAVEEMRMGWRIPSLCTADEFLSAAEARHLRLVRSVDLTPLTRPGSRLRDRLTAAVGPVAARLGLGRMPFYGNMIGGHALQVGLRDGFVTYRMLVLTKAAG
jgi:cyclopropane fatty-acyl-phospholipid synthase-like methyltransferase